MPVTVQKNPRIRRMPEMSQLKADDMKRLTLKLDKQFVKNEAKLFRTEGGSGGSKWAALNPEYAKRKKAMLSGALKELRAIRGKEKKAGVRRRKSGGGVPRLGTVNRVLQLSGSMADTLRKRGESDHIADWKLRKHSGTVSLGTKHELAAIHAGGGGLLSTGGRSGAMSGGLPARDPIQMTGQQQRQYLKMVANDLKRNKLGRMIKTVEAWRPATGRAG